MHPAPEELALIREAAKRRGLPESDVFREGIRLAALGGRAWREPLVAQSETYALGGRIPSGHRTASADGAHGGAHVGHGPDGDTDRTPLIAVADTSGFLALFNRSDPQHAALSAAADRLGLLAVSPLVLAELHTAVTEHADRATADAVLLTIAELTGSERISLADPTAQQIKAAVALGRLYPDTPPELTDTLTAVLAAEYGTHAVLTVDRHAFRTLAPITEHERFLLLPDDAG